ncbi:MULTISPECIES: sterol desaturase family protein [Maribacter]|uniref:Sterol desaturase/sphingolipid hydroxylase, fatty acid hydroxylase superfamily n=4 Tax=Maribacter TaxID=252356 RepID=A0A1H4RRU5_9FLAO|nr:MULTISPECIES: sterol desaturase family protein [Maribacter]KSA13554.1 Fatty acid hydroxylase family protein [Maribacter dokdonensis DSW-8]MBU2901892.1 sterol desaturase family protein [Maribacter dokdonensis]MDP2527410.1 sterol desaturase family protein [Maribacter dokdonensis]CAG2532303.1 Sterol desaturase/sphingolipid hydroxylase [Maribacter dokdonensis]SDS53296.1 Sterol desaturase/sphingolipid hydroxylase, fatty acid hydroxylase superfamily [Maribacter dokdonensis]|tara:strand:- start:45610 stop:46566 length:957 start_codon:yes stop_codon:yes gene_type:complete
MDFTNPLVYGAPAFIAFILLELTYSKTHGDDDLYDWKDFAASSAMGIGSAIIGPLLKVILLVVLFEWAYELFNPMVDGVRTNIMGYESFGYAWYVWLLCQLADDFTYYWFHRANHEIRILWAAHIVHHSSDNFNLGTAIRNGWFTLLYKPFFYVWMPIIGFPVEMVVVCLAIESFWQFQLHSQYVPKMGFIEKIFNTHTMHQVHHAQNVEYLDKNHGGFLNCFDKMFGTWKEYDEEIDVKFGVIHAPNSNNPIVILTHEFKDIWADVKKVKKFKHKLMYIFGPPGWSHDGSTMTVKQQQRLFKQQKEQNPEMAFDRPN